MKERGGSVKTHIVASVIPTEVDESLAIFKRAIVRDISTPLDMTKKATLCFRYATVAALAAPEASFPSVEMQRGTEQKQTKKTKVLARETRTAKEAAPKAFGTASLLNCSFAMLRIS